MFEGFIASLLNKHLGWLLVPLDSSKNLDFSLLTGKKISLKELTFKEGALEKKLGLPFKIKDAYVGELSLGYAYDLSDISVVLRNVRICIAADFPKTASADAQWKSQAAKIQSIENSTDGKKKEKTEPAPLASTFTGKIVAKIASALSVTVENVHVCFECGITEQPFALHMQIDSFKLSPGLVAPDDLYLRKAIRVAGISIKFEDAHEPVLAPLSAKGDIAILVRERASAETPKFVAAVRFGSAALSLRASSILSVSKYASLMSDPYADIRPRGAADAKTRWQFACWAIRRDVKSQMRSASWGSLLKRRAGRDRYISLELQRMRSPV